MPQRHLGTEKLRTGGGFRTASGAPQDAVEPGVQSALLSLKAAKMSSWHWDRRTDEVSGDEAFAGLWGLPQGSCAMAREELLQRVHPDDRPTLDASIKACLGGADVEVEYRICRPGKEPQWVGSRGGIARRSADGLANLVAGVTWDLTDLKRHQENLSLMAQEMDHRIRNAFGVIRALITIGERGATEIEAFAQTLRRQVQAMADAHMVSAQLAQDKSAPADTIPVELILNQALAPWFDGGPESHNGLQVELELDRRVAVRSNDATALAMMVYELAQNATKYGALGDRGGVLTVRARLLDTEMVPNSSPDGEAVLIWDERLGEGKASQQSIEELTRLETQDGQASGFGTILLQHCASQLGGKLKRELRPEGLLVRVKFPNRA